MEKKRLDYLDMVKGFGIFCVVLGHMEDISTVTRIWISSFHMPLFFIVSGLLMALKNEDQADFGTIAKKKFRGIIIPYLWFSLSYFIIDIANLTVIGNIDKRTFIEDTISHVTFYGMSVLWFLPALFLGSLGFLLLNKKIPAKFNWALLLIIGAVAYAIKLQVAKVYALNADNLLVTSLINIVYIFLRAAVAMSFVGEAFYIKKLMLTAGGENGKNKQLLNKVSKLSNSLDKKSIGFLVGIILLAINIVAGMTNSIVDLRNINLNNVILYYIAAFTGVYGLILIFKALPTSKIITYYGRNSIIVMACHVNYYILYAGIKTAHFVNLYVTRAKHYVFVAVTVIVVFLLSIIVIEGIRRFFPFVLGKPMKATKQKKA